MAKQTPKTDLRNTPRNRPPKHTTKQTPEANFPSRTRHFETNPYVAQNNIQQQCCRMFRFSEKVITLEPLQINFSRVQHQDNTFRETAQVDTTMGSESDISRPMVLDLLKIRCNIRHENWKTKSRNNLTSNAWGSPSIKWSYGAKWFMNISEAGILCFLGSKFNLPYSFHCKKQ